MPTKPDLHRAASYRKPQPWAKKAKRKIVGRPWRRLRELVLKRDKYLCQTCRDNGVFAQATEVDHVIPLSKSGSDELSNLRATCKPCHRAKTALESRG